MATDWRAVGFWLIGAILVFFGTLLAGAVDPAVLGATTTSVVFTYLLAFVLILIGGMLWISAAILQVEES